VIGQSVWDLYAQEISPPFPGTPKYPFSKHDSIKCGRWKGGSQDYPYFGAPRDASRRMHAGIDLYPLKGSGTPIGAIRDGKIIKVAPFYTRRNGEVTYAVLVDHKEFVANYAELQKPSLLPGTIIKQKQVIGLVSGTNQLHFELYKAGTTNWISWYGPLPQNLVDPTDMMTKAMGTRKDSSASLAKRLDPTDSEPADHETRRTNTR
jgi:murein DD-endopeptidase MepM/ murein hydrolase activator NlpD